MNALIIFSLLLALMPVHKEMESRVGKATVEAAYKAADFVAPK